MFYPSSWNNNADRNINKKNSCELSFCLSDQTCLVEWTKFLIEQFCKLQKTFLDASNIFGRIHDMHLFQLSQQNHLTMSNTCLVRSRNIYDRIKQTEIFLIQQDRFASVFALQVYHSFCQLSKIHLAIIF